MIQMTKNQMINYELAFREFKNRFDDLRQMAESMEKTETCHNLKAAHRLFDEIFITLDRSYYLIQSIYTEGETNDN